MVKWTYTVDQEDLNDTPTYMWFKDVFLTPSKLKKLLIKEIGDEVSIKYIIEFYSELYNDKRPLLEWMGFGKYRGSRILLMDVTLGTFSIQILNRLEKRLKTLHKNFTWDTDKITFTEGMGIVHSFGRVRERFEKVKDKLVLSIMKHHEPQLELDLVIPSNVCSSLDGE